MLFVIFVASQMGGGSRYRRRSSSFGRQRSLYINKGNSTGNY